MEEPSEKWKLNKADWPSFKALCESDINETILKAKDPIDNFTTTLYEIAEKTIPKTSTKTKKKKSLGLRMIVKHLFKKGDKLYNNLILVQCIKI